MRLSKRFAIPEEFALLYEFVNTLDQRRYVENGEPHVRGDEIATPAQLSDWMRMRRLLEFGQEIGARDLHRARQLRNTIRGYLAEQTAGGYAATQQLAIMASEFPLALGTTTTDVLFLRPAPGSSALGNVLAELLYLGHTRQLRRLKLCASEQCRWVFFDRSKPARQRWCSSSICGNRQNTRRYRLRLRNAED